MKKLLLLIIILTGNLCVNYSFAQDNDVDYRAAVIAAKEINTTQNAKNKRDLISLISYKPKSGFNSTDTDISTYVQWECIESTKDTIVYVTTFKGAGGPYSKPKNSDVSTEGYVLWVTIPTELNSKLITEFANINPTDTTDMKVRLAKILGLPISETGLPFQSRIITLKVPKNRLLRPAFNPDPYTAESTYSVDDTFASLDYWKDSTGKKLYRGWFNEKCAETFLNDENDEITSSHYPFTGLGYTYDWDSTASDIYGLSEFIVMPHTDVIIVDNVSLGEYYERFITKSIK